MKDNQTIPDDKLSALMNVIFNVWWGKWKSRAAHMTDEIYEQAANEALHIMTQGEEYPIVKHLVISFLYELAARIRGEYTEKEKNKLLDLINKE